MTVQPLHAHDAATAAHLQALHSIRELTTLAAKRRSVLAVVESDWVRDDPTLDTALREKVDSLEGSIEYLLDDLNYTLEGLHGVPAIYPSTPFSKRGLSLSSDTSGLLLAGHTGGDLVLVAHDRRVMVVEVPGGRSSETATLYRIDLVDYDDLSVETVPVRQAEDERDFFSEG